MEQNPAFDMADNSPMNNLPVIEWPEDRDPEVVRRTLSSITILLGELAEQAIGRDKLLYIVNPVPARNIERLIETLSDSGMVTDEYYHHVSFGHKDRSWAACFMGSSKLECALPAFFAHGSECLNILVIENRFDYFDSGYLSSLCDLVFLQISNEMQPPDYVGISFEADTLVEIHTNIPGIEIPLIK